MPLSKFRPRQVPRLHPATWYSLPDGPGGTSSLVINEARYTMIHLPEQYTFTDIGLDISTAGASTAVLRLGLYTDALGAPDDLVQDFGQSGGTNTAFAVAGIATTFTVPPGTWWFLSVGQGSGTMPQVRTRTGWQYGVPMASSGAGSNAVAYTQAGVSGALPSTATPVAGQNTAPAIRLKTA